MTMINPNPAAAHHHHQQNFSKQHSCHEGVYVGGRRNNKGLGVMSWIEGYGCSSEFEFELEPETNLIPCLGVGGRGEGGSDSESEEEDHHNQMADQEDESRTTESVNEATASTSLLKDATRPHRDQQEDEKWLQLSIGGGLTAATATSHKSHNHIDNQISSTVIELDLLPGSTTRTTTTTTSSPSMFRVTDFGGPLPLRPPLPPANIVTTGGGNGNGNGASSSNYYNYYSSTNTSLFMQQHHHHHHGEIEFSWGAFRPIHQRNILSSSAFSSSSPSRLVPPVVAASAGGPYFAQRPFLLHPGLGLAGPPSRPSIDFRVIDPPPRRPSSGIWFILQAAQNQAKEPFLPQIPKSFLRIKDGRMTIRIVMKYLVNKLKLENESEVEIKCRGQQIQAMVTLQHVRDCIWTTSPTHIVTLLPHSSSSSSSSATDHIMVLHYGRSP